MVRILKKSLYVLVISIFVLGLCACGTSEMVKEHINDPIVTSGDLQYYAGLDNDTRKNLCENKHIEFSGVVSKDGYELFYIGDKKVDGLCLSCTFDDDNEKLDTIEVGDYITAHGVCKDSFSDSMFIYGCKVINISKQSVSDELVEKSIPVTNKDTKDDSSNGIAAPIASMDCEGLDYKEVERIFSDAGYKNVELHCMEMTVEETSYADGTVITVWGGSGLDPFNKGDMLDVDDEIGIGYIAIVDSVSDVAENNSKDKNVVEEKYSEEVKQEVASYNIDNMSGVMYAISNVNIRNIPDKNGNKLGSLVENQEINVTGKTDNGWYRIDYNGTDGFVKGEFLSAEKKQEVVTEKANKEETAPQVVNESQEVEAPPVVNNAPVSNGVTYIGNKTNMKLHRSNCSGRLPKESNRQYFNTLEEAIAAGYPESEQCKNCHPFR